MKLNSTMLVGLLALSSSLMLQALSPAQVRKLQEEGQAAIRKGDAKTAQRKIHELKVSGNSGAAVPLERELLEGSVSQLKYTKESLAKARERLAEAGKGGRSNKKEIADQQKRINELEDLLLETARETSELEELFRNAIKELELAQKGANPPPGAGVEAGDDATIRAAKTQLDKDLIRIIGNKDVHNLDQINSVNDFTYNDYLYWGGTLGWNAKLAYLWFKNNPLRLALIEKEKEYAIKYKEEKKKGSRLYREAAMVYLADLDASGLGKYSARQILPKDSLWNYLDVVEVENYINAVRKINAKKGTEVAALAKQYREQKEAEERAARAQADEEANKRDENERNKAVKEEQEYKNQQENEQIWQRHEQAGDNF